MEPNRVRIVFLGGKQIGFQCLNYLLKNVQELNVEVVAVFTNSSSLLNVDNESVTALAQQNKIPVYSDSSSLLELSDIDLLLSVQYHQILKPQEIGVAKSIAVNLHMAPVPEYRGCNQFSFAIIDGVKQFGTTLHRLEKGIDNGAIITERRFDIPENCFVQDLYKQTVVESLALFKESISDIVNNEYSLTPQNNFLERTKGFHLRNEINTIKAIDSSWPIEKQKRHFRASWFPPFDPPYDSVTQEKLDLNWYNSL